MTPTTAANIAKTETTTEIYADGHLLWLACIVEAVDEDDDRPVVADDIEGRAIEEARLDYPEANLERDREDVLAELVAWGCLDRTEMRDRGFRSGYLPTEKGYAIAIAETKHAVAKTELELAELNLATARAAADLAAVDLEAQRGREQARVAYETGMAMAKFWPAENFKPEHGVILQTMAEWPHDALSREDMESGAFVAAVDGNAQQWHVWPKAASFPRIVAELTRWRYLALTRAKVNTWSVTEKGRAELKAWKTPKAAT